MQVNEIRQKFIEYFKSQGHEVMPSSSLIPKDDPSVLLTTAGMQQFKKWYSGEEPAKFPRVATIQKCVRTNDIEEVGDATHLTFFEMLGNFSFADYFKEDAIKFALQFIEGELKVPRERIWVSIFQGDEEVPRDEESAMIWKSLGVFDIREFGREDNFWGPTGTEGPCGPTSEIYVDDVEVWNLVFNEFYMQPDGVLLPLPKTGVDTGAGLERLAATLNQLPTVFETDEFVQVVKEAEGLMKKPSDRTKRVIADHIRTATFLLADGVRPSNLDRGYILRRLIRRAVRYGKLAGIEQSFCSKVAEKVIEVYGGIYPNLKSEKVKIISELEIEEAKFTRVIDRGLLILESISLIKQIIANKFIWDVAGVRVDFLDYLKSPEKYNKGRDKYLYFTLIEELANTLKSYGARSEISELWIEQTGKVGHLIRTEREKLTPAIIADYQQVSRRLIKEYDFIISGQGAFKLFATFGFPFELTEEVSAEKGIMVDQAGFSAEFEKHQEVSRKGMDKKFAGGLADKEDPKIVQYHTAAHLLLAALREVLGEHVHQKGSNITAERIRFDFSHDTKMTDEEKQKVEDWVNERIGQKLQVTCEEMSVEEAKKSGAEGEFSDRYGDNVKVYSIGNPSTGSGPQSFASREICGGPHVENTSELGHFKIKKEESSSAGVRRIKAVLE